jgi:hypothetical protein
LERKEVRFRLTGDVEAWMGGREDMTRCRYPTSSIQDGGGWREGGEIGGVELDGWQFNRHKDRHHWRSMRYGDIIFRQGELEMPPGVSPIEQRGPFPVVLIVEGESGFQASVYCTRHESDSKRHGMCPWLLHSRDSPGPKNGMGIMTKSPWATLFRGDGAQSPGSKITPA